MRFLFGALALLTLVSLPASAQQRNPILEHYRAYLAALDGGDLEAAVTEARAALAASEARDGDGGRTPVLLVNVATTHLMRGEAAEARTAAQRALELARGGGAGVDPLLAEIVLARSELGVGEAAAADRLAALLAADGAAALDSADIYLAAAQLGSWALEHRNYEISRTAWGIAASRGDGSPYGEAFGIGRAKTSEAIAIILEEIGRHGRYRVDRDQAELAYGLLVDAMRALGPLAQVESPNLDMTVAQRAFAESRVWLTALTNKMDLDGQHPPHGGWVAQGDSDGLSELGPVDLSRPRCLMRFIAAPMPEYPNLEQVAGVAMFFRVNEAGEVTFHQVAAYAGSRDFADAVDRVAGRWRAVRLEGSAPNCRMAAGVLQTVSFAMADG